MITLTVCLALNGCTTAPAPVPSPSPHSSTTATAPASANEVILKVNELNSAAKFTEAVVAATEGLKAFPQSWELMANRGSSYLYLDNPKAAQKDFSSSLKLCPPGTRWALFSQRARAEAMMDLKAQAEKDFLAAQKSMTSDADPELVEQLWRLRGNNLLTDLRPKESIPCFTASLKIVPNQPQSLGARALAYAQLHDQAHYEADLKQLKTLNPKLAKEVEEESKRKVDPAEELAEAGTLKLRQGDNQGAIASLTRAIALNPGYALAYQKRGSALQNLSRFPEAVADLTTSYQLDHNEVALFNRASCYLSMDKPKQARADLEEFLKIGKDEAALGMARDALRKLP